MYRRPWLMIVSLMAVLAVAGALGIAHIRHFSATSRLPERGIVVEQMRGCPGSIDVVFDELGYPHVSTHNEAALWFAQGYLHARDRFFQMELARRATAGRLAELFGEAAVSSDRRMRTLRLAATARRQAAQLSPGERFALDAYASGVNAALARFGRWIAPEQWLIGIEPEPWRIVDSLAIGMGLQLDLTWSMQREMRRAAELLRLGRDRAVALWGWTADEAKAWIPPGEMLPATLLDRKLVTDPLGGVGSNSWAVAPDRTATGRPLLANDPHLGVRLPGTWYAIHLRGPGIHVAGGSIPGMPGVLIGHTDHVAWGLTMVMGDDQDLFHLTLDDSGTRELFDGRWQDLRTVTENLYVRWAAEPILLKIRLSEHGPLVREDHGEALALSWTAHHGPSPVAAFLAMNRAITVEEVADAWSETVGPMMNLVAADTGGHILQQVVGRPPNRRRGGGRLPAPGAEAAWAWRGFRSVHQALRKIDPPGGFVATANHDLFAEGDFASSLTIPGDFDPPWRVRRIRRALESEDSWTVTSCVSLQGDVSSGRAIALLKSVRPILEAHGGPSAAALMKWDGRMEVDSVAAYLFSRFLLDLEDAVGGDEAARAGLARSPLGAEEILRLLAGGLSEEWWDDVTTTYRESERDILFDVLDELDAARITDRWGTRHTVTFLHPLTRMPGIGNVFGGSWNRGPFPVGGDGVTVNAHYWSRRHPYRVTAIPSMRFVADVGNWDATVLGLPVGESGRPWSAHYADQITSWLDVRPAVFRFSKKAVEGAAAARLRILPTTAPANDIAEEVPR